MRDRQEKITQLVQSRGFVTIDFLAEEFGVTPQTIRRDINILSEMGLVRRYHAAPEWCQVPKTWPIPSAKSCA